MINVQKPVPVPLSRFAGNSAAGVKSTISPKPEVIIRRTSGPETINPLVVVAFTKAAYQMYTPTTIDEPGPFNFQVNFEFHANAFWKKYAKLM